METTRIIGREGHRRLAAATVFLALGIMGAGAHAGANGPITEPPVAVQGSPDGDRPMLTPQIGHGDAALSAAYSADGRRLVTTSWDYTAKVWDVATGQLLHTLEGHTSAVNTAVFSSDGSRILTASGDTNVARDHDNTARIWDAATGKVVRIFTGHTARVMSASFSPDETRILTASADKTARIWSAASVTAAALTLAGHTAPVTTAVFSPDGKQVVTASEDKTAILWDSATGRILHRLTGHTDQVVSAVFSHDGKEVVTASADHTAKIWDSVTGQLIRTLKSHADALTSVAFSRDDAQILTASKDGTAILWAAGGQVLRTLKGHTTEVSSAEFSPDGLQIVTTSGIAARTWEAATGKLLETVHGNAPYALTSARFSPDSRQVATTGWDGACTLWLSATGQPIRRLTSRSSTVISAVFSPDGKSLLTSSFEHAACDWDAVTGHLVRTIGGRSQYVSSARFSPDASRIVTVNVILTGNEKRRAATEWNTATGKRMLSLPEKPDASLCAAFSPDGQEIVTANSDLHSRFTAKIWNAGTGKLVRTLTGHTSQIMSAAFSPDGKEVVTASTDKTARIVYAATGQVAHVLRGHTSGLTNASYSPDGKEIATASSDHTAKIWDAASGRLLRTLAGHSNTVMSAAFSPDGKKIVTAGWDGTAKIWDVGTGSLLQTLAGHDGTVSSAVFSPNGNFVLTSSYDQTTKLWNASTGKELCTLLTFNDGAWAVTDPTGRYDASNGGDVDGLHWVIGNEPIALSQLRDRYYEPGLLAKVMGFDRTPLRDVEAFDHVKLYPDVTAAVDPSGAANRIAVHLIEHGGGIGRVQVYVNDVLFQDDARPAGSDASAKTLDFTVDVSSAPTLRPGGLANNDVRIVAFNGENWLPSRGAEMLSPPPTREAEAATRRLFAIVAGTSDYAAPALHLKFPAQDAVSFAQALKLGAGGDPLIERPDIILLAAGPGTPAGTPPPTKANLAAAFARITAEKPSPGDILVVYLAGHGVAIPLADSTYCYLAQNANSADTTTLANDSALRSATTATSAELADWMGKIGATYRVVILDTCAAGAAGKAFMDKRAVSGDQIRAMKRFQATEGCHVLMGCAADKVSYEASQYGQGLLTYALLQGMKGPALRENAWIDVRGLFGYVEDTVPKLAGDIGGIQQPSYQKPDAGSFDIGRLTETDRGNIKLTAARPQILRIVMGNKVDGFDDLDIAALVRARFSDTDAYAARGAGSDGTIAAAATAAFVYVDADHLTGAIQPVCQYVESGDKVTVTITLIRDHKRIGSATVTGRKATDADRAALAAKVAAAVSAAVAGSAGGR